MHLFQEGWHGSGNGLVSANYKLLAGLVANQFADAGMRNPCLMDTNANQHQVVRISETTHGHGFPLKWRHNKHNGVSNHRRLGCILKPLFRRRSKKPSKLRVTGLWEGNSPVTGEFPVQRASNVENIPIWWRSLICAGTYGWVNNPDAVDLRRQCAYYDVTVMHFEDSHTWWWISPTYRLESPRYRTWRSWGRNHRPEMGYLGSWSNTHWSWQTWWGIKEQSVESSKKARASFITWINFNTGMDK